MYAYSHLNDIFITQRLKSKLNEIRHHSITTVIAPMGFGKTTALNWWAGIEQNNNSETIILRQMIVTNSITDFWNGFCKAFKVFPELAEKIRALGYPKDAGAAFILSEILYDGLYQSDAPIYFILDDMHILNQASLASLIIFLSKNMPDCVHIILMSRNQIFNAEEQMKLGNHLFEISADDLRLSEVELSMYAKHCGIKASEKELINLAIVSEGWISMVYLNFKSYVRDGHWLSGSSDIFTLIEQVLLDPLDESEKEILILLGMTDEFTLEQADYLWNKHNAKELITSLSRNNAFITKNERDIYRCHHMLRECIRKKFGEKPLEYRQLGYTNLGRWYLLNGEYIQAYNAFSNANNWDGLMAVFERDKAKSLNTEHSRQFFKWIENCPKEILLTHPVVITACMLKMFSFHNIPELKRMKSLLLVALEQDKSLSVQERNNLLGDSEISESFLSYNNISAMSEYHRRACKLLSRVTYSVDPKGAWTFSAPSILMMYHREAGSADKENSEMKECMPYYYKVTNGHGSGAEHSFAADLYYERGKFTDADILRRMAFADATEKQQFSVMICCEFLSMRMALFNGEFKKMNKIINDNRELLLKERQYTLLNTLDLCSGFLYALLEKPDMVPKWLREGKLTEALVMFPATPMMHTFYNQVLLSLHQLTEVAARKDECMKLYGVYNNILCDIWLHIQTAIAYKQLGKEKQAFDELNTALNMAMPDGIIMPFAESGEIIYVMLKQFQKRNIYADDIRQILLLSEKFTSSKHKIHENHLKEIPDFGLSKREYEIARLAALRKTNSEIAEELHIAEGTVRNQLSRIFDKLNISGTGKNKRIALKDFVKSENSDK